MKQIAKTDQILSRLRTAYGPDANLDDLAVFEIIALTTLPLRKSSGIFKGARVSLSLLSELAASVNSESIPLQAMHNNEMLPFGRFFYGEVRNDELIGLIAVDGKAYPDKVSQLDNGTIDQVSVGFAPKRITCSGCGFNFMDPKNLVSLYTLTCDEDHVIGRAGIFAHVDGLEQFFELSLVGKGASEGARVVGPSDAQLQHNEQFRLAASANPGLHAVRLSPTLKEPETTMTPEQMASFSVAVEGRATAVANLATVTAERDAHVATLAARDATIAELTAQVATATENAAAATAHKAGHDAALAALTAHAKKVLVAVGKPELAIPTEIDAVLALIDEHSAAFAAVIPTGGAANSADTSTAPKVPVRVTGAFRAPK